MGFEGVNFSWTCFSDVVERVGLGGCVGVEPHWHGVVNLSKTYKLPKVLVNTLEAVAQSFIVTLQKKRLTGKTEKKRTTQLRQL